MEQVWILTFLCVKKRGNLFSRFFLFANFFNKRVAVTVIPKRENINVTVITQIDKEAVLLCYDSK